MPQLELDIQLPRLWNFSLFYAWNYSHQSNRFSSTWIQLHSVNLMTDRLLNRVSTWAKLALPNSGFNILEGKKRLPWVLFLKVMIRDHTYFPKLQIWQKLTQNSRSDQSLTPLNHDRSHPSRIPMINELTLQPPLTHGAESNTSIQLMIVC